MIAAGAGIAPFRGFIQELSALKSQGKVVPPAILFYGCRSRDQDDLYRQEMDEFEETGVVSVRRAFSRPSEGGTGKKYYVGDRLWDDREEVRKLWESGAKVYVCGSRAMGDGVKKVMGRVVLGEGVGEEEVKVWFEGVRNLRYAVDVFD